MTKKDLLHIIKSLKLNLEGTTVLTEAATGPYMVTPLLASLAGAKKVYAFCKESRYGSTREVFLSLRKIINEFEIKNIELIDILSTEIIRKTDIITNSGHLRPLNEEKLKYLKPGAVVSLMYEKWELRESDIDINFCKKNDIKVGAVNERHKKLHVFDYLGDMTLKLIFDSGLSLNGNKFILVCNNDFGPYMARTLSKVCSKLGIIVPRKDEGLYKNLKVDLLSNFPSMHVPREFRDAKALILAASPFQKVWIGKNDSPIPAEDLIRKIDMPYILRFAGDLDLKVLTRNKIRYFPADVDSGHMGIIPSDIGVDPVIRLQAGGLKVAESLLKNKFIFEKERIVDLL